MLTPTSVPLPSHKDGVLKQGQFSSLVHVVSCAGLARAEGREIFRIGGGRSLPTTVLKGHPAVAPEYSGHSRIEWRLTHLMEEALAQTWV